MKTKETKQRPSLSSSVVDDGATERFINRLRDLGLIVNAGAGRPAKPTGKKEGGKK